MEVPQNNENDRLNVLMGIQSSYTVSGTHDEVDKLMIKNFLQTLAEIALDVASRKGGTDK